MCWECEHPEGDYYGEVVRPTIERCGWMVQHVAPDRLHAALAYTVGLTEAGAAELVATGLPPEASARLLNDVAVRLREQPGVHGQVLSVDGREVQLVSLPEPRAHLFVAADIYGPRLRALQLVYADERGTWPWAKGFRGGRGGQPVLGPRDG